MTNEMQSYAVKSTTRKNGVLEQSLKATEEALHITLDSQYQALFKLVNAPEFGEWCFYPIKDSRNLRKTFDDVVKNTKSEHENRLASEFIVISGNGTGNFLCMRNGEQAIYHQDHEEESPELVFPDLKTFIEHADEFGS